MTRTQLGKTATVASTAFLVLALLPRAAAAQDLKDVKPSRPLVLKGEGSFFVGGNTHFVGEAYEARPGQSMINQMYVQFQKPARNRGQFPIVFVHGCCLSSKTWETTPDGRMGWYEYFTRRGFDTYMADQVGRARSGFDGLQYEKVRVGEAPPDSNPNILIATDQFAWQVFRFGDFSTLTPFPDERFPMNTVGVGPGSSLTFYKQVIPDMTATLGSFGPNASDYRPTPAALAQLGNELNGAILVGHSQSSSFPTRAALQAGSHGVRGIIQLETGCFGNLTASDIDVLKKIPILIMEGDHYPTPRPVEPCPTEIAQITAAGGDITYIHLPDIGIHGNSHMFMQDNNNLQIADIIIRWIDRHVKGFHKRGRRGDHDGGRGRRDGGAR
jgi:hypothetical protein